MIQDVSGIVETFNNGDEPRTLDAERLPGSDLLRMALAASEMGVWDWYPEQRVLRWDARCKAIFGLPSDAPVDLDTFLRGLHPDDRPAWERTVRRSLDPAGGGEYAMEYRILGLQDKVLRWAAAQGKCYFDAAGRPARFVGTILDITARKQVEEQLRKQADFEQHLIGMVSHDLRNPLQAAMIGAQMLQRAPNLTPPLTTTASRVVRSLDRASRLIRDLLDFTQMRLGTGLTLFPAPADLAGIARACLDELRATHPGREIALTIQGDTAGTWDEDRVQQLVGNLIGNALNYSSAPDPVEVRIEGGQDEVTLRVRNRGPPIPAPMVAQLFRPFVRGDAGVNREGRSIGLGLYIVDQIVSAHRGRVTAQSSAAEGTVFTVALPRGR